MQASEQLDIHHLCVNGGSQPRAALDDETIAEYAEAMSGGAQFPPVVVFYDGEHYWLADGYHRRKAALKLGRVVISADIRQGTLRDAVLYSAGANSSHGLRRTNADKRRAVLALLNDREWSRWSDREIARRCAVSPDTVGRLRTEASLSESDSESESPRLFTTKHGTPSVMHTRRIGRTRTASDEAWDELEEKLAGRDGSETKGAADEWIEHGDEDEKAEPAAAPDIQAEVNAILSALGGTRSDPLRLYQRWANVRRMAREQGRALSDFLYDRSEEEIAETINERVSGAYPALNPAGIAEEVEERAVAAYHAARPDGSFEECLSLFERVGMALVMHPDLKPQHERLIRRLCHRIIETGFGLKQTGAK